MGVTHAWELYGDNEPPDIQAVGKGLGGGSAIPRPRSLQFFSSDYKKHQVRLHWRGPHVQASRGRHL